MLRTGKEHLERLRDGRIVYIGDERVEDVTSHPAFRNAARTIASIYDMKADPANAQTMSFVDDGERCSMYFLQARTQEDLRRRTRAHKMIADMTHGLFGRSPDHFASSVTAMAIDAAVFNVGPRPYAENLVNYYQHIRRSDHYVAYAVLPPQAARDPMFYQRQNLPGPSLEVVREDDDGIAISGMKMLATGAIFADDIWIGNIQPLAPTQVKQAVTCAIACNAKGVTLWSRQSLEENAKNEFDSPLSWRFDETDSMVMCDNVKVPWERVFLMDDAVLSRDIYIRTPGHCYANHQSNVRFRSKLQLIVGLASRVAESTGADQVPAVRELLGRLAAMEALLSGMIDGQIEACESWPEGFVTYNRRYMYAALNWCVEMYSQLIDILRELSGGGVFQMPASVTVMRDPMLRKLFEQYWQTPQMAALDRAKLCRYSLGSEATIISCDRTVEGSSSFTVFSPWAVIERWIARLSFGEFDLLIRFRSSMRGGMCITAKRSGASIRPLRRDATPWTTPGVYRRCGTARSPRRGNNFRNSGATFSPRRPTISCRFTHSEGQTNRPHQQGVVRP